MKKTSLSILAACMILTACNTTKKTGTTTAEAPAPLNCGSAPSFAADIRPILEQHCVRCHGGANTYEFNFTLLEDTRKAASKGELTGTIKHERGFPKMPQYEAKLDQSLIDKIDCWIQNGMKE